MIRNLAIYGAGGLGREIYDLAERINFQNKRWAKIFFIDDINDINKIENTDVYKFDDIKKFNNDLDFIVAVGEPSVRQKLYNKIIKNNFNLTTLIAPTAIISPTAKIASGSIISEFVSIHSNVYIGNNCLIQPYSLIGHDVKVGNHSVLSTQFTPGGGTIIGESVYIGMQSSIKEKTIIGNNAIVAMGASVFNDVPENAVVIGNPARITKGNETRKVFK